MVCYHQNPIRRTLGLTVHLIKLGFSETVTLKNKSSFPNMHEMIYKT